MCHEWTIKMPLSYTCKITDYNKLTMNMSPVEPVVADVPEPVCATEPSVVRPDTPCVAVCSTTFDEICRGCGRTVVEVSTWVVMTVEQKESVWQRILSQGYPRRNG